MADFTINHPKDKSTVSLKKLPRTIAASGRADDSLVQISGTCEYTIPPDPTVHTVVGKWIATLQGKKKHPGDPPYKRWIVAFRLPVVGDYNLKVKATFDDGSVKDKESKFKVVKIVHTTGDPTKQGYDPLLQIDFVTISYAPGGSDIDSNDFTPYGELTPDDLDKVVLKEQNSVTEIKQLYVFSDPNSLQFWCVQFDVLTPGTVYTLTATDLGGGSDISDNLTAV